MKVVFSDRAYASVLAETTEKIKTETGGLFLGTVEDDTWYIIEAIDPGPKSVFEVAYFEYDQKYTQHLINKVANLYDRKLELIGLWHRHPGSFDQFSSTDDGTNAKYASMRKEGAISALVNIDPSFRITVYQVDRPCRYKKIAYQVGNSLIPEDLLKYKTPERYFSIMENLMRSSVRGDAGWEGYHRSVSLAFFMKFILSQIDEDVEGESEIMRLTSEESARDRLAEEIVDDVTFLADSIGIETAVSVSEYCVTVYQEAIDTTTKIDFELSGKEGKVLFSYEGKRYAYHSGMFREAYETARAEMLDKVNAGEKPKTRNQTGVINSVIKIISFNRNEE